MTRQITRLDDVLDGYDAILSDVWGVVHNGVDVFGEAVEALKAARAVGKPVVLITNSPRPGKDVADQLDAIGVPRDAWDALVSSGDVTRDLIRESARRIFHLGPERDVTIYDDLDVELVEEFEASAVVCTGLLDDESETPEDYAQMLARMRARNLPFICANPDIVVERGDRLIWCAGALARDYGQLGGRTLIAGKPHRPIYEAAFARLGEVAGRDIDTGRVLAIGDGMFTDVKGAADYGLDVLYVSAGIHFHDYALEGAIDEGRLKGFLERHGYTPVASIPRLR
jgi:HAD superfamily hydrolase (TIGR01459 family)